MLRDLILFSGKNREKHIYSIFLEVVVTVEIFMTDVDSSKYITNF